ncbi:hypothetical protein Mgra_00005763 [Meloidogyne graminicola]|uniref:Major facilitator superfamily (MFS) profile domain-containing protein n=1 Tax=Meloidogyne graminicola TaxID=189291 RepID=A0A8S9ZNJ9_9BILA|nr:hypothetical protein Mgra_00005763 [Meloidogyne graminicola]
MTISQIFPADEKIQENYKKQLNEAKTSFIKSLFSFRIAMLILSLICLTVLLANSLLLNFTVICMKEDTSTDRGLLIAGTAMGGIIAIGILPPIIDIFGLRLVLSFCGIISGIATTALPELFIYGGFWALLVVRMIQGFCFMPSMPTLSKVTTNWAKDSEHSIFLTILSLHMQLGIIVTMPITGWFCNSSYGWPAAYYFFGILCLILFILFFIVYRDWPHQSSLISQKEVSLISKNQREKKKDERVPYLKMLTDRAVWACISVAISSGLSHWLFAQYGPLYIYEVLNYNINSTGIWIAVPYFVSIFTKLLIPLIEYFPTISLWFKIIGITFICQLINVCCYLVLGLFPSSSHLIAQTALIIVLSANGAGFVGLASNCQVIARQHAHFILSLVALINYLITLIQPLIIAWIASSKTHEEWSRVFFSYGAISLALNLLFVFGAGTERRQWTGLKNEKENKKVMENNIYIEKL